MENIIFCEVCGPSIFILINIINVAPIFLEMKFDAEAYLRPWQTYKAELFCQII